MLPTDSKIFPAIKTPPTWDLEFFRMITHFGAVFFVGNDASNRKQDFPSHQNFLLPGTWNFFQMITHLKQSFLWKITLMTDSKIFIAGKTASYLGLRIFFG